MEAYLKVTKVTTKNDISGLIVETNGLTRLECLMAAADIVIGIEQSVSDDKGKAKVRTQFLTLLNEMRNNYENSQI